MSLRMTNFWISSSGRQTLLKSQNNLTHVGITTTTVLNEVRASAEALSTHPTTRATIGIHPTARGNRDQPGSRQFVRLRR